MSMSAGVTFHPQPLSRESFYSVNRSDTDNEQDSYYETFAAFKEAELTQRIKNQISQLTLTRFPSSEDYSKPSPFSYVRDAALDILFLAVKKKLETLYNNISCPVGRSDMSRLPHRVFSWSYHDFIKRLEIGNFVWIDVLCREVRPECLDLLKIKRDINEYLRYWALIYYGFRDDSGEFNKDVDVMDYFENDATNFDLDEQFLEEKKILHFEKKMCLLDNIINTFRKNLLRTSFKQKLEDCQIQQHILAPIENRLQFRWLQLNVDSAKEMNGRALKVINDQIGDYNKKLQEETLSNESTMIMLRVQLDDYRNRIDEMSELLEKDIEKYDNEITYIKSRIIKLRNERHFLEDEIVRFHDEIRKTKEQVIEEEERELQKRQEHTAKEAQKKQRAIEKKKAAAKKRK